MLAIALAGCGGEASHLPPLWQWPGAAVGSAVGNAAYEARRERVRIHVAASLPAFERDMAAGGGPSLERGFALASVPQARRGEALAARRATPRGDDAVEALTVPLMVHGG